MAFQRIANRFREIVSGSPDGKPDWVKLIAEGEGPGLYGPDSAVWEVHGCVSTLVGGIRALLLQAAHPAALTGVLDHSRYETDFLGRLAGTARWLTITTFGVEAAIAKEAARVCHRSQIFIMGPLCIYRVIFKGSLGAGLSITKWRRCVHRAME